MRTAGHFTSVVLTFDDAAVSQLEVVQVEAVGGCQTSSKGARYNQVVTAPTLLEDKAIELRLAGRRWCSGVCWSILPTGMLQDSMLGKFLYASLVSHQDATFRHPFRFQRIYTKKCTGSKCPKALNSWQMMP